MTYQEIDIDRALELRRSGLRWREVAVKLSAEVGRQPPFQAAAVQNAFTRLVRGKFPKDKPEPRSREFRLLYAKLRRCGFSRGMAVAECEKASKTQGVTA